MLNLSLRCNPRQHGRQFTQDLIIADPDDLETARCQDPVSLGVVSTLALVRRSVDLHHEGGSMAVEIDNESINELLTTEVQSGERVSAQGFP